MKVLSYALQQILAAMRSLREALQDDGNFRALFLKLGWRAPAVPSGWSALVADITAFEQAVASLDDDPDLVTVLDALASVDALRVHLDGLSTAPPGVNAERFLADARAYLLERLLVDRLATAAPRWFGVLQLLGIINAEPQAADAERAAHVRYRIDVTALEDLFAEPAALPARLVGWGSGLFDAERLAGLVADGLARFRLRVVIERLVRGVAPSPFPALDGVLLRVPLLDTFIGGNPFRLGFLLAMGRDAQDVGTVIVAPWLPELSEPFQLGAGLQLRVISPTPGPLDASLAITPGGFNIIAADDAFAVEVSKDTALTLGRSTGTRLEMHRAWGELALDLDPPAASAMLGLDLGFVLTSDDLESPLARVLRGRPIEARLPLGLRWSSGDGFDLVLEPGPLAMPGGVTLGPVHIDGLALGLAPVDGDTEATVSAVVGATIGPVDIRFERLGWRFVLDRASRGALGLGRLESGPLRPQGAAIALKAGPISGAGHITRDAATGSYAGALALRVQEVSIGALGVLETVLPDQGYSLAAVVAATFAPLPLGLGFTLNGVGGLVGINRRIDLQALRDAMRGEGIGDIFFAADPLAQAARLLGDLKTYFPAADGRHVFGPAAKIGWGTPTVVEATVALLLEVPAPVRLVLLGRVSAALPSRSNPIVELNVDVLGELDFARKTLAIDATLHHSQVAGFDITGDMALRMGWGDQPSFALSVGGFHSQFRVPPGFPALRPIKIPIGSGDNPRLDITGFLALTSNTAQVGAQVDLYVAAGPLNIVGNVGFEALIQFVPFEFQTDLWGDVALRRGTSVLASVHLDATVRGPTPYHLSGEACLSLWFVDLCVGFDATFGETRDVELPPHEVWPLLEAALEEPRSWSSPLPPAAARAVVIATPAGAPVTRIDPAAALVVRQKVVPLNRTIERFGHVPPSDADRFEITAARLAGIELDLPPTVDDWFAPGQFEAMDDTERLSRPGYEKMVAGAALAGDLVTTGAELIAPVEYETITFPSPTPAAEPYTPDFDQQIAGMATAANTNAPLRPPRAPAPLVTLAEEMFVIASTDDLAPRLDLLAAGPRGPAEIALRAYLADNPAAAGSLQVVPRFEAMS